jgi:hypothetical protein
MEEHIDIVRREARDGDAALPGSWKYKADQLHGRVSGLRNEIRADYDKTAPESSRP